MDPDIKRADNSSLFVIPGLDLASMAVCAPAGMTREQVNAALGDVDIPAGSGSVWTVAGEAVQCLDADRRRHYMAHRRGRACEDERLCENHCGTGPCSRRCQVCLRLAFVPTAPCPACPDAPRKGSGTLSFT